MLRSLATLLLVILFSSLPFSSTAQQPGTTRFVYDGNGRIQAVISPTGEATVYEYDQAGNIVSISRRSMTVTSIVGFNPVLGVIGSPVTVYGTGFSANAGENIVTFNGTAAAVVTASSTELVVTVPAGASDGFISVTSPSGSATSTAIFHVLTPVITGFSPLVGPPGSTVHLTGRNFENTIADNVVKFNGVNAEVQSATDLEITAVVPEGARSGKISVTTPHGTAQTSGDFFVSPSGYTTDYVEVTGRIAFGESKRITLTTPDKIAILIFEGAADQRARVRISQAEIESYQVSVYNPAEEVLTYFAGDTTGGFTDAVVLPQDDTYAILVVPSNYNTGSVTISLFDEAAASTIVPGGPSVQLNVVPPARDAYAVFDAVAGQRVSLRLDGVTIPAGTVYYYKPGGQVFISQALAAGDSFIDALTLPAAGRYTIFIEPQPDTNGAATLTLYNVVDVTGIVTLDGPPLDVTTTVPGQNARITFYADPGESPTLNVSDVTLPGNSIVTVYADSVEAPIVPPATLSGGGGSIPIGEITQSATYTILIDPQGPITGGMTLSLNRPPDVTGTLVIDGAPVTVPISLVGQNARLTFDGQAGQRVTLEANGVTIPASTVSIIRPDGTTLVSPVLVGPSGRSISNVSLPSTGTHTVFIDPTGGAIGSMTLALVTATGIIVPGGSPVTVNLTTPGESTSLTFTGTAGQRVSLGLSEISLYNGTITINKPDGTPLLPTRYIYEGDFIDALLLTDSGTYTIVVTAPEDDIGSLTLTLYDSTELVGSLVPDGSAVVFSFTSPGQNARISFPGNSGQRVSLRVSDSMVLEAGVSIVGPDGTTLGSTVATRFCGESFCPGRGFIDTVVLPTTGVYSIVLDPSYTSTGNMTLTLYDVPPDVTTSIVPDGPAAEVTINVPGQNARLTFEAEAGQRVFGKVNNLTIDATLIAIYNPDGTRLMEPVYNPDVFESGFLPATGTYTILIDPFEASTGSISLNLLRVPADVSAAIIPGGPPVSISTTAAGQNARLTFNATAGQRVTLRVTDVSIPSGQLSILRPDGTQRLVTFLFNGLFIDTLVLTDTGVHTILIDPIGEATGAATVQLNDVSDVTGTIEVNGPPVTVNVPIAGQRAVLSFNGTAGQWLRMTVISTTVPKLFQFSPPSQVSIVAPNGTFLGGIGNFNNIVDTSPLPVNGTYTIIVDPVGSATGSTTLSLAEVPPVGSISIDGPPLTIITRVGRISRLTFEGTAGQRVSLKGSNFWGTRLSLYGPDMAHLGTAQAQRFFSPPAFIDAITLPSTGTYHVAVSSGGSSDGSDHVTVTLSTVTDVTGPITPGVPTTVSFTTSGQNARLTFEGVAGQRVVLHITNVTVSSSYGNILTPDGAELHFNFFFNTQGAYIEPRELPITGTYTVFIDPEFAYTGNMTATIFVVPPDASSVVEINGPSQTLTTTTPGQRAVATFTGLAGQIVTVTTNVSGTTDCVEVNLVTPTGWSFNGTYQCSDGVVELAGMTLPEDGVYSLIIDPQQRTTGTFGVTVTSP